MLGGAAPSLPHVEFDAVELVRSALGRLPVPVLSLPPSSLSASAMVGLAGSLSIALLAVLGAQIVTAQGQVSLVRLRGLSASRAMWISAVFSTRR